LIMFFFFFFYFFFFFFFFFFSAAAMFWGPLGGGGGGMPGVPDVFQRQYRVYSGAFMDKAHIDNGGKVILPNSAMDELAHLNIVWPMMFRLTSASVSTHCGVLEFSAQEGHIYIPYWMMQHLRVKPGAIITVRNVSLPKGTFVKLRPQTKDFIEDISNPRPVLEAKLRNFSCLTKGDTVIIGYNDKHYCIDIMEVRSARGGEPAVCIIDTDVEVDFERPADMPESPREVRSPKEPTSSLVPAADTHLTFNNAHMNRQKKKEEEGAAAPAEEGPKFTPFTGAGRTVSGKPPGSPASAPAKPTGSPLGGPLPPPAIAAAAPASSAPPPPTPPAGGFKAFVGTGRSLK